MAKNKTKLKQTKLKQIEIDKLRQGKFQPRRQFDKEALQELAESIQSAGLIQPVVVRPIAYDTYEIIAGERRWRAAQLAKLDSVPCLVNHYDDAQAAAVTAIENVNRVDLNPIEEAQSYQRLCDEFTYSHEEVAAIIGKSRAKISNSIRLLKLGKRVQDFLITGAISEGHGKVLAALTSAQQYQLAQKAVSKKWSVRKIEQEAKKLQSQAEQAMSESDPNIDFLERALADHIGCQVKIDFEDGKGKLKIDFHNLEILEGIFHKMGFIIPEQE